MTPAAAAALIRSHFDESANVGLVLPDGWFGRPYDNMSTLDAVIGEGDELSISLDTDNRILVRGDVSTSIDDAALTISGFSELIWSWRPSGSVEKREQIYASGEMRLVRL